MCSHRNVSSLNYLDFNLRENLKISSRGYAEIATERTFEGFQYLSEVITLWEIISAYSPENWYILRNKCAPIAMFRP